MDLQAQPYQVDLEEEDNMATYIPQMNTQTSRNNWGQSVANNLLDAVQKNRAFELQENQFENQKAQQEIANARAERQMGLEKQRLQLQQNADTRTQEVFDLKKKQMNDEKELAQILIKNKLDKSKYTGQANRDLDAITESSMFGSELDPEGRVLSIGAPDEQGKATKWYNPFDWQYKKRKDLAKQVTKSQVGDKPKLPEDTYKFINNIGMLGILPELVQDNDQTGNYLYNEVIGQ